MTRQLTLDDAARFAMQNSRRFDNLNSVRAAQDAFKTSAGTRRLALLTHAAHPDGLTDFELADLTGIAQTSIGKRRGDLVAAGYIVNAETARPAPSGSRATVWRITAAGMQEAQRIKQS